MERFSDAYIRPGPEAVFRSRRIYKFVRARLRLFFLAARAETHAEINHTPVSVASPLFVWLLW